MKAFIALFATLTITAVTNAENFCGNSAFQAASAEVSSMAKIGNFDAIKIQKDLNIINAYVSNLQVSQAGLSDSVKAELQRQADLICSLSQGE